MSKELSGAEQFLILDGAATADRMQKIIDITPPEAQPLEVQWVQWLQQEFEMTLMALGMMHLGGPQDSFEIWLSGFKIRNAQLLKSHLGI